MGGLPLILLDTHVLLWLDWHDPALGPTATRVASDALEVDDLLVSAVSFWEVAMLLRKRRLKLRLPPLHWRRDFLDRGVIELQMTGPISIAAAELDGFHADPADRLIVATAVHHGAMLLTADRRILAWPGRLDRQDART